jgi:hypothetical protein
VLEEVGVEEEEEEVEEEVLRDIFLINIIRFS